MACSKLKTVIGDIWLISDGTSITDIFYGKCPIRETGPDSITSSASSQIKEYMSGKRKTFNVPVDIKGTEFQKKIWNKISEIGHGKTASYKEIAIAVGMPQAVRAVATAIGRNHIPIIIPCHRVIGSDGQMRGFAWGIDVKIKLLELEKDV